MTEVKVEISEIEPEKSVFSYIKFYLRIVFHLVAVVIFWFVSGFGFFVWKQLITEDIEIDDPAVWDVKWLSPCYLTNWNLMFQTCFLTMSLVYDLLEWMDRHETTFGKYLRYYRDVIFSGVVVPITLFISSMFWTIYWIDRELVFPQVYDNLVPWWFNHCVHTNIVIVLVLETLLQARRHPANLKLELWLIGIVDVVYAIVYYSIYFLTNRWLYGVFGIMTWWQICLYQILIWVITLVFYGIQFPINRLFHKEKESKIPQRKTANQNTERKDKVNSILSNSWSIKFRPKESKNNSRL